MFVKVKNTRQREIIVNVDHITSLHPSIDTDGTWALALVDFDDVIRITEASASALINLLNPVDATHPGAITAPTSLIDELGKMAAELVGLFDYNFDLVDNIAAYELAATLQSKIAELPS